ncbi:MAG: hypothetical protein HY515_03995 [Candidatus Aenigmarchaeota archaeon]|nr:hypothetical protein [Candidatus Aenigmarchaeota archaeon]
MVCVGKKLGTIVIESKKKMSFSYYPDGGSVSFFIGSKTVDSFTTLSSPVDIYISSSSITGEINQLEVLSFGLFLSDIRTVTLRTTPAKISKNAIIKLDDNVNFREKFYNNEKDTLFYLQDLNTKLNSIEVKAEKDPVSILFLIDKQNVLKGFAIKGVKCVLEHELKY